MKKIVGIVQHPFVVVTGPQGPQGDSGSSSGIANNNTTNASFIGSGQVPASLGAIAGAGQSSSCTFGADLIVFSILLQNEREGILCQTSHHSSFISALSDPGGLFLSVDMGVGIWVHKALDSNVIQFKNRTGASNQITIQAFNSTIIAATPWA